MLTRAARYHSGRMVRHARQAGMLLLLLAGPVCAQFAQLAATDDGTQLYFVASMVLKSADPEASRELRVYRFAGGALSLFAERGQLAPEWSRSNGDGVAYPSVSGGGEAIAIAYHNICRDPQCAEAIDRVEVRGRETLDLGPGEAQISRNGRWAHVLSVGEETSTLVDLASGQRTTANVGATFLPGVGIWRARLASDGSFLATTRTAIAPNESRIDYGIWKQGKFTVLNLPGAVQPVALTDDGATVLGHVYPAGISWIPARLAAITLASAAVTTIAEAKSASEGPLFLAASNNGRRVLYKVTSPSTPNGPAYVWDAATAAGIAVPLDPDERAADGVLSGNGQVAYIATTRGRIVKFDVASKTSTPLFPATPYCDDPSPVAGGSFTRLYCSSPVRSRNWRAKSSSMARPLRSSILSPARLPSRPPGSEISSRPPCGSTSRARLRFAGARNSRPMMPRPPSCPKAPACSA